MKTSITWGLALGLSLLRTGLWAEELIYVVEELKGPVSILEAGQAKARAAEAEDVLDAGDEIRTGASGSVLMTLNANTTVQLGANARLKVAELSPNKAGGFLTKLRLYAGKVVSQVQKLAATRSSYTVEAGSVSAGVRGTVFEVGISGEDDVETTAEEGEVELASGAEKRVLGPGRFMAFKAGRRQAERILAPKERERFKGFAAAQARAAALRNARAVRLANPKTPAERLRNEAFLRRQARRKGLLKKVGSQIRTHRLSPKKGKGGGPAADGEGSED